MRGYTTSDQIRYWLFKDAIPLTKIIILANAITFVAITLFKIGLLIELFGFAPETALLMPWTLVTYPLIGAYGSNIVGLLFALYWMWIAGGSLERSWGTARFALYFFSMCAVSALGIWAGAVVLPLSGVPLGLVGLWLPLAGLTVSFAMLNPEQQILFMFILPLKLKYLALLDAVIVVIQYGQYHLLLGLFALAGCAYGYWYILPKSFGARQSSPRGEVVHVYRSRSFLHRINPFKKIKQKRDEDRLRKLFGDDDR